MRRTNCPLRSLLLLSQVEALWNVDMIDTSRLSFHWIVKMSPSRWYLESPRFAHFSHALTFLNSLGNPDLFERTVPHALMPQEQQL